MSFSNIIWWAACIPIALGLLLVFLVVLIYVFLLLSRLLAYERPQVDEYVDVDEEDDSFKFFLIAVLLLLFVPATGILLLLWNFDLVPEAFSFLPNYYSVGRVVTGITIAILCVGPIWATLAAIAAVRRRIAKHSKTE